MEGIRLLRILVDSNLLTCLGPDIYRGLPNLRQLIVEGKSLEAFDENITTAHRLSLLQYEYGDGVPLASGTPSWGPFGQIDPRWTAESDRPLSTFGLGNFNGPVPDLFPTQRSGKNMDTLRLEGNPTLTTLAVDLLRNTPNLKRLYLQHLQALTSIPPGLIHH
jgi:hypothetical protein